MKENLKKLLSLLLVCIMVASLPVFAIEQVSIDAAGDSSNTMSPLSLLPIDEVYAYIDLSEFTTDQLFEMTIAELLGKMKDSSGNPIPLEPADATASVWADMLNENGTYKYNLWEAKALTDKICMMDYIDFLRGYFACEIVVGSGNQLDSDNVRYLVEFGYADNVNIHENLDFTGYAYPELYKLSVAKLMEEMNILITSSAEASLEIFWDVKEMLANGVDFGDAQIRDGWLQLGYNDSVKFAPTAEECWGAGNYLWNEASFLISYDGIRELRQCSVYHPDILDLIKPVLYSQDSEGNRTQIDFSYDKYRGWTLFNDGSSGDIYVSFEDIYVNSELDREAVYYLGVTTKGIDDGECRLISGFIDSVEEINAQNDITAKAAQDMALANAGLPATWLKEQGEGKFTLAVYIGNDVYFEHIRLRFYPNTDNIEPTNGIFTDDGGRQRAGDKVYGNPYEKTLDGETLHVQEITYMLDIVYGSDRDYYIGMEYINGDDPSVPVDMSRLKAYTGIYTSPAKAEAAGKINIAEELFGSADIYNTEGEGYTDDFSSGVEFSIFYGEDRWYYKIQTDTYFGGGGGGGSALSIYNSFRVRGMDYSAFSDYSNEALEGYMIPDEHDSLAYKYPTALILDSDADLSSISVAVYDMPQYMSILNIYHNDVLQTPLYNDFTSYYDLPAVDLSNTVHYVVTADGVDGQADFHVSAVKKHTGGSKLFVNGPSEREVIFYPYQDFYTNVALHDIFVANIGDEPLTGINVTLSDAQNVKLDDYWTIGGEGNNTLAAFTSVDHYATEYGELDNVAKIRLIPDGEGEIRGTLTISADGQDDVVINLTGTSGTIDIMRDSLPAAVKYVPYSESVIIDDIGAYNYVYEYEITDGRLPEGLSLSQSGKIEGTPMESGSFDITLRLKTELGYVRGSLKLLVKNNSDTNVDNATDTGYHIITPVPDTTTYTDRILKLNGDFSEFRDLWIDGVLLERDVDYTAVEGSTVITIKSQTFARVGTGTHTIAASFEKNGELKVVSQNYTHSASSYNNSYSSGGSVSTFKLSFETNGGSEVKAAMVKKNNTIGEAPVTTKEGFTFGGWYIDKELTTVFDISTKITASMTLYAKWIEKLKISFAENGGTELSDIELASGTPTPALPIPAKDGFVFAGWYKDEGLSLVFDGSEVLISSVTLYAKWVEDKAPEDASGFIDVSQNDWFYNDVKWAYENKLMIGTSNVVFAPSSPVSGAMIVTVLARMTDVDADEYKNVVFDDVYENMWYTEYAKWAKSIGLVDGIAFNPPAEISREAMAVILARFIEYMEVEYEISDEYINFADAADISDDAMEAMQLLYKLGIFKGKGNNVIDPLNNTTRGEFATLIKRIDTLLEK